MDINEKIDLYLNEGMKDMDKNKIKEVMKKYEFMNLRDPLKKAGFKVDFQTSPVPFYKVSKGRDSVVIVNKKYADDAEFIHGEMAMGEM